jgi:hypothetical protein
MTAGGIRGSLRSRKREGEEDDGGGPNGGNGGRGGGSSRGKDGEGQPSNKRSKQDGPRIKLRTYVPAHAGGEGGAGGGWRRPW